MWPVHISVDVIIVHKFPIEKVDNITSRENTTFW